MKAFHTLQNCGQSIWLDYICRGLVTSGELKNLVDDGVTGLTSNPTIFQKSICETGDYNQDIAALSRKQPDIKPETLYEFLAVEDIRLAADVLRPVYDNTDGKDGFVSLEVSPFLAADTAKTISEAGRLWQTVNRPNLMIKVPATPQGFPAVEALIAQGINVNVTLIFSLSQYEGVTHAYIRGLNKNPRPARVASVASFFVSRIDTAVDKMLETLGKPEALALRGKVAVACCRLVYRRFTEIFYGDLFADQKKRGALVQRPLWGSTGTKNPRYSDVLYIEELIGPDTVNTVPMNTLRAFREHGKAGQTIQTDFEAAVQILIKLRQLGIDLTEVTEKLQRDGVQAFIDSFTQLMDSLKGRCLSQ